MGQKTLESRANVDPAIIDERAIVGSTLKELCEKADIDFAGLNDEIDLYNNFARTGVDVKLGRDAKNMTAFSTRGPYYAVRIVPNILNTQGGPQRNENTEILDTKGNPIPHLYSAGEFGGITSICIPPAATWPSVSFSANWPVPTRQPKKLPFPPILSGRRLNRIWFMFPDTRRVITNISVSARESAK